MVKNNSNELIRKIKEDIEKSGFPLELQINELLIKDGWQTSCGESYLDKEEGKSREIDIYAYKSIHKDSVRIFTHLCIEAKSSKKERPWVIFCTPLSTFHKLVRGGWGHINTTENLKPGSINGSEIDEYLPRSNLDFCGTAYYEALKGTDNDSQQIYKGILSSCKSAVYKCEKNGGITKTKQDYDNTKTTYVSFFFPLVITNSDLFMAKINKNGVLVLKKANYVPIRFNYSSAEYGEGSYYPDIINLNGFKKYLKDINKWQENLLGKISREK